MASQEKSYSSNLIGLCSANSILAFQLSEGSLFKGALNDMDMSANAQALINISRKRLCSCAAAETREAWKQVKAAIREVDPVLADKMVPECIYRGFCPEFMNPCGYSKTPQYQEDLKKYRNTNYN